MAFCSKCGTKLESKNKFCPDCGFDASKSSHKSINWGKVASIFYICAALALILTIFAGVLFQGTICVNSQGVTATSCNLEGFYQKATPNKNVSDLFIMETFLVLAPLSLIFTIFFIFRKQYTDTLLPLISLLLSVNLFFGANVSFLAFERSIYAFIYLTWILPTILLILGIQSYLRHRSQTEHK
jgi:hypothetical protein